MRYNLLATDNRLCGKRLAIYFPPNLPENHLQYTKYCGIVFEQSDKKSRCANRALGLRNQAYGGDNRLCGKRLAIFFPPYRHKFII